MKATLDIVTPIYNEVKARARREDKTFRAKVEELLRLGLQAEKVQARRKPFKLNFPKGSGPLLVDLLDKDAMAELEDEKYFRALRKK